MIKLFTLCAMKAMRERRLEFNDGFHKSHFKRSHKDFEKWNHSLLHQALLVTPASIRQSWNNASSLLQLCKMSWSLSYCRSHSFKRMPLFACSLYPYASQTAACLAIPCSSASMQQFACGFKQLALIVQPSSNHRRKQLPWPSHLPVRGEL